MPGRTLLSCLVLVLAGGCGDDGETPSGDGGPGSDSGPTAMEDGGGTDAAGSGVDTIPAHACTNLSGVFRVTVDSGDPYGPFVVRLDPRPGSDVDWDVISCDTTIDFTAFLHFVFPDGMTRPLVDVELPHETAAIDPIAEGFFNGSIMSMEMPAAWPRPVLGFRAAFGGGAESTLVIDAFDDTTLAGSLDSEASGGVRVHIDFDVSIE